MLWSHGGEGKGTHLQTGARGQLMPTAPELQGAPRPTAPGRGDKYPAGSPAAHISLSLRDLSCLQRPAACRKGSTGPPGPPGFRNRWERRGNSTRNRMQWFKRHQAVQKRCTERVPRAAPVLAPRLFCSPAQRTDPLGKAASEQRPRILGIGQPGYEAGI